jgi:outer membrane protein assembly factor BamA
MTFSSPLRSPLRWIRASAGIVLLVFFIHAGASAQDTSRTASPVLGVVDTIMVGGNDKTEAYVILDEMTIRPGSLVTSEMMEYDRGRIYSLGLFTRVDLLYDSLGTQHFLFVDVRERWYLIPVPVFGFRDGDTHKFYFGGGLLHYNFRGRNQKLYGSVVFGYDPAISFSFADPQLDRENNLYFASSLGFSRVKNRSVIQSDLTGDFYEEHEDINGTVGKRFNLFETAGINIGLHSVSVTSYLPGRTVSPNGRDTYLYASLSYMYDSRNLLEYATSGTMISLYASKNGFGESTLSYSRFGADARKYIPIGGGFSLATRLFGSLVAGGLVPTYAHTYFGAGERIRGYYRTVIEGEDITGGTVELRYSLLDARTVIFSAVAMPSEFSVWRFGISLSLFTDTGATWFRGDRLTPGSFATGYGGGIDFLLPYSVVLRTEYAWNEFGVGQFIIDFRGNI